MVAFVLFAAALIGVPVAVIALGGRLLAVTIGVLAVMATAALMECLPDVWADRKRKTIRGDNLNAYRAWLDRQAALPERDRDPEYVTAMRLREGQERFARNLRASGLTVEEYSARLDREADELIAAAMGREAAEAEAEGQEPVAEEAEERHP